MQPAHNMRAALLLVLLVAAIAGSGGVPDGSAQQSVGTAGFAWSPGPYAGSAGQPARAAYPDLQYDGVWHGEAVSTAQAVVGSQSWHVVAMDPTPGAVTPATEILEYPVGYDLVSLGLSIFDVPQFHVKLVFRVAVEFDGSTLLIASADSAGALSAIWVELEAVPSTDPNPGIRVRVKDKTGAYTTVRSGIGVPQWHEWFYLEILGTYANADPCDDTWRYIISDGTSTTTDLTNSHFCNDPSAPSTSQRLVFQPLHANNDVSFSGYYIDDVEVEGNMVAGGQSFATYTGFESTATAAAETTAAETTTEPETTTAAETTTEPETTVAETTAAETTTEPETTTAAETTTEPETTAAETTAAETTAAPTTTAAETTPAPTSVPVQTPATSSDDGVNIALAIVLPITAFFLMIIVCVHSYRHSVVAGQPTTRVPAARMYTVAVPSESVSERELLL